MLRIASSTLKVALVLLFAAALWLRITSLEALPLLDGDEAWHAIQLSKMVRGEPFATQTPTGIPLSPFHAVLELPLLLLFKSSLGILRIPTVITGILAVLWTYRLGTRMLDRTTGLIAATLLACLPVAIIYSRTGYESAHTPLYTLLLIDLASREKVLGLVVLLSLAYFVHPMNIFILPVLLAVLLGQSLKRGPGSLAKEWRSLLIRMIAVSSVVLAIGLYTLRRPIVHWMSSVHQAGIQGRHDPLHFLAFYGRLFLGVGHEPRPVRDWCFWMAVLVALAFGLRPLIRNRQWDRVALLFGLLTSLGALLLVGGSEIIRPPATRYGLYLVVPSVLAFACLVNGLLIPATNPWRIAARSLQFASLLALGGMLLSSSDLSRLTKTRVLDGRASRGEESIWTFGSDEREPHRRALSLICDDFDRAASGRGIREGRGGPGGAGRLVMIPAGRWKDYGVLEYLALERGDVRMARYEKLGMSPEQRRQLLREYLQQGAYAISVLRRGEDLDHVIQSSFPPERVQRWEVLRYGEKVMTVYRLKRGTEPGSWEPAPDLARKSQAPLWR
jgi:hypothetical protein